MVFGDLGARQDLAERKLAARVGKGYVLGFLPRSTGFQAVGHVVALPLDRGVWRYGFNLICTRAVALTATIEHKKQSDVKNFLQRNHNVMNTTSSIKG